MGRVFFNTRENIDTVSCTSTTTYAMTEADSGKTFLVSGGTQAITLLPVASLVEGWNCRFITTASPGGHKTIGAGTAIIHGASTNSDATSAGGDSSDGTAKTNVVISASSQAGNRVDIVCDGSLYHAHGVQGQDNTITFS